jgi:RNA-binding protein
MTSKQRAYLKGLAITIDPIYQVGKSSLTPEITKGLDEALAARELIKINVLKNCLDDPNEIAQIIAERTHSEVVQVIGKKIVLYRESKEKKKIGLSTDKRTSGDRKISADRKQSANKRISADRKISANRNTSASRNTFRAKKRP